MRAIGWDEVKLDPAARLGQPILYKLGVMVAGVVQVNRIIASSGKRFERFQQPYRRGGIDGFASIMRVCPVSRSIAP